ncbi:MAG: site-specific integrase [Telluria sp.]
MATKRRKNSGWEYIVKRAKVLPKPFSIVFADEAEGDAYIKKLEAMLDSGIVPPELLAKETGYVLLGELITDYLTSHSVADSDVQLMQVLYARIGATRVTAMDFAWVEKWILSMKTELNVKPGTIRHYVGALGRCLDWAGNRNVPTFLINPIRKLPKGYSSYSTKDGALAKAFDEDNENQEDNERERRLQAGEDEAIRFVLGNGKPAHRERSMRLEYREAVELLYDLALETAMRMSEIFTITLDQLDISQRTVFLDWTKNGNKRQVPLSSVAVKKIEAYLFTVATQQGGMVGFNFEGGRLFPFWDGVQTKKSRKKVTDRMSQKFGRIFANAGCPDLRFHDLRHEATSRFFELTTMSEFEIMKITGHSSTQMLRRYANLRASNLAAKLW